MATIGNLLEQASQKATATVSSKITEGEELFSLDKFQEQVLDGSPWSRDASGNLVRRGVEGVAEQTFDFKNEEVRSLGTDDKAFKGNDDLKATQECLALGKDETNLSKCVEPNVHADGSTALRDAFILQKLGFQVVTRNTTLGRLKMVESVDSWKSRNGLKLVSPATGATINNTLNLATDVKQLGSNALAKLREMVRNVNRNPSVLNPGWKPPKDEKAYVPPARSTATPNARQVPKFNWVAMRGGNVEGNVAAINNVIKTDAYAIRLGAGTQNLQHGGGKEYAFALDQVDDKAVFALQSTYNDLRARLEARGKSLDETDRQLIENELKNFNKLHRKLLFSVELLRAMNDMVDKGLITQDKIPLREVMDKQHLLVKRVDDKKRKLVGIINVLGSAVAVEVGSSSAPAPQLVVQTELKEDLENLVIQ